MSAHKGDPHGELEDDPEYEKWQEDSELTTLSPLEAIGYAARLLLADPSAIPDETQYTLNRLQELQRDREYKAAHEAITMYISTLEHIITTLGFVGAVHTAADIVLADLKEKYNIT